MKTSMHYLILFFLLLLSAESGATEQPALVPLPNHLQYTGGYFPVSPQVKILANGPHATGAAAVFNAWLKEACGYTLPIVTATGRKERFLAISVTSDTTEKYSLTVTKKQIVLEGGPAGLLRGSSTLLQFFHQAVSGNNKIPCLRIHDRPEFAYRGVHLDVCRHFLSKEFVKRYIDLLALHKMNTFHWHLTDDQGWRIEIKKYPKLTEVGAWRNGSMVGPYRNQQYDTLRYGGYYTQEDIREVLGYAALRQITVIPEIEMPGHAMAALAAYPQFSCTGAVQEVARGWGVFDDVFCVNDSTFAFLEDVLTEVLELFPSRYIHIGGDECPKTRWKVCPKCNETRYAHNLRDEHELQSYFIQRIEKFLNSKGRKIIGWDEILEGGLAPNATVMSWRGTEGGKAAARAGHDAIMTPGSHCYFDHYQGERAAEPLAFGGYTPLEKVYAFRPVPDSLTQEQRKFILGAQANLWTEYMYDEKQVEYML
ncbi:MAG: beta-N-acetylhexosaminidase, partial [Bacteroidia bacterium]|nr:beta-N-acetylhexosaminidase [Bacteroidia bacterium]